MLVAVRIRSFLDQSCPPHWSSIRIESSLDEVVFTHWVLMEASEDPVFSEDLLYELLHDYNGQLLEQHDASLSTPSEFLYSLACLKLECWLERGAYELDDDIERRIRRQFYRAYLQRVQENDVRAEYRRDRDRERHRYGNRQRNLSVFYRHEDLPEAVAIRREAVEQARARLCPHDQELFDEMLDHGDLRKAAEKMGLTYTCVESRWYRGLRPRLWRILRTLL